MSKEILLNKLEKQFSYYELVDEMQETINYSKIVDFLDNEKDKQIADLEAKLVEKEKELYLTKDTLQHHTNIYNNLMSDLKTIKINYAVEQLELARRTIDSFRYNENKCLNKKDCIEDCIEAIDNQIKQLKEGK